MQAWPSRKNLSMPMRRQAQQDARWRHGGGESATLSGGASSEAMMARSPGDRPTTSPVSYRTACPCRSDVLLSCCTWWHLAHLSASFRSIRSYKPRQREPGSRTESLSCSLRFQAELHVCKRREAARRRAPRDQSRPVHGVRGAAVYGHRRRRKGGLRQQCLGR